MALRPVRRTNKAKRAIKGKDDSKKLISNIDRTELMATRHRVSDAKINDDSLL